jgi:catechol 2,3-dioxygenase-like lactoylglutathione lyase family enzyme
VAGGPRSLSGQNGAPSQDAAAQDASAQDERTLPSARLVPELNVSDFERSLAFYTELVGFSVLYARPEEAFAYLSLGGAELMIQRDEGMWSTGPLEYPYGRGLNFEIHVEDVDALQQRFIDRGYPIFVPMEERWYRRDAVYVGQKQFLVQDPDGYLLRFGEDLGISAEPR